ncbi:MAG: V-type ATP synthase subunit E [archaeon]
MMEKMISKINEDAQKERKTVLDVARAEKKRLVGESMPEIANIKRQILEQGKGEAKSAKQRIVSEAIVETRRAERQLKDEFVSSAVSSALKRIDSMPRKEYHKLLSNLLSSVGSELKGATVYIRTGDKNLISRSDIKVKEQEMPRGIIIQTVESTMDLTFPAIFERKSSELRMHAGRELFK